MHATNSLKTSLSPKTVGGGGANYHNMHVLSVSWFHRARLCETEEM